MRTLNKSADWPFVVAALVALALLFAHGVWRLQQSRQLLVLPMIGALDNCLFAKTPEDSLRGCKGPGDSAVHLIEATLQTLGPAESADGDLRVGYTLNVPLLRLFMRDAAGEWRLDRDAVRRVANTIRDVKRPALLYLFSTHFGVNTPMEDHLLADPSNLSHAVNGPLKKDKYYHMDIYPWSLARTDNELTARRTEAMQAVLAEVCQLSWSDRQRVVGVTLLGEVHQLFPGFETGMGFASPYVITDYSDASREGFQVYLRTRFGHIGALNQVLESDYGRFEDVLPPAKDIRTQPLSRYQEHLDAYAGGRLPVLGWVRVAAAPRGSTWVRVYLNGQQVARVPVTLGRQDVLAALPDLDTADVGWRHDLDFSRWAPGLYRIDVALDQDGQPLQHLATRTVGVVDRTQAPPQPMPQAALPAMVDPGASTRFWVDFPLDQTSVYFNPLAPLWHAYRETQVTRYLQHFRGVVGQSCLGRGPIYTHQIVPFSNPGWDESRFAIGDSLTSGAGLSLGISLYGEPIYGESVTDWLRLTQPKRAYGITEFHPLKAMSAAELRQALVRHRRQGARFFSFFLEPLWFGQRIETGMNLFSLDPDNHQYGSDVLYHSVGELLSGMPRSPSSEPLKALAR